MRIITKDTATTHAIPRTVQQPQTQVPSKITIQASNSYPQFEIGEEYFELVISGQNNENASNYIYETQNATNKL